MYRLPDVSCTVWQCMAMHAHCDITLWSCSNENGLLEIDSVGSSPAVHIGNYYCRFCKVRYIYSIMHAITNSREPVFINIHLQRRTACGPGGESSALRKHRSPWRSAASQRISSQAGICSTQVVRQGCAVATSAGGTFPFLGGTGGSSSRGLPSS
jgi:hypothetical protein